METFTQAKAHLSHKRRGLLWLPIALWLLMLAGSAQATVTSTVTIGGSSTNTSANNGPIFGTSSTLNNSRFAYIYTKAELGLPDQATITKVSWKAATTAAPNGRIYIYIRKTDYSSFNTLGNTWAAVTYGATTMQSYASSATFYHTAGNFYTPSGGTSGTFANADDSNIVIAFQFDRSSSSTGDFYYEAANNMAIGQVSNSAPATLNGNAYDNMRPVIQITYTTPDPMVYSSTSTTQIATTSAKINAGTTKAQIIRYNIATTNSYTPLSATSFTIKTTGTTDLGDIQNLRVYYTGSSTTFSDTGQFGSTVATPGASQNITDNLTLSAGNNYFWVTYDIPTGATYNNAIDAEITGHTIGGTARTLTTAQGQPSGNGLINTPLSGTYTIGGTTPDYASFTTAISALTTYGVSGPVTFNVRDGSYNEKCSITAVTGASAANRITFQSENGDSSAVVFYQAVQSSGTFNYLLYFDGADYVTFKGMTLKRTGTTYVNAQVILFNGDADNNEFLNCVIANDIIASNSAEARLVEHDVSGTFKFNLLRNNLFQNGSTALYLSPATVSQGCVIEDNTFTGQYSYNLYAELLQDIEVRDNDFSRTYGETATACAYFNNSDGALEFTGNKIDMTTGGYGLYMNACNGSAATPQLVANNFIRHIHGGGVISYGIYVSGTICTYVNFYHNSVSVSAAGAFAMAVNNNSTNLGVQNNIFSCYATATNNAALYVNTTAGTCTFDYNDYHATGTANLVRLSSTNFATLSAWQAVSTNPQWDDHSLTVDPLFNSATDLYAANPALNGQGTALASVTEDYDGDARNGSTPDIGADEFTPAANDAALLAMTPSGTYCRGAQGVTVKLANTGTAALTSATINWNAGGTAQTAYNWTGSLASGASTTVTIGTHNFTGGTVALDATVSTPNGATDPTSANNTVSSSPVAAATLSGTYTIGGASPDYATFALALSALTTNGVCGPVTFNVRDGSYNEQITIPATIANVSATNTITFQSENLDSTKVLLWYASGTGSNYLVQFNGADYITFRKMSFQRTGTTSTNARVMEFTGAATNNKVQNCRVRGITTTSSTISAAVIYSSGSQDNANEFSNNLIKCGSIGFNWYGTNSSNLETGTVFTGNTVDSTQITAIELGYQNGAVISDNTVTNVKSTTGTSSGIGLNNSGTGNQILRNKVTMSNGGHAIYLSAVTGTSGSPTLVAANFLAVGGSASAGNGIYLTANAWINIQSNNIHIYNTVSNSVGINFNSGSNQNLLNNCIYNSAGSYVLWATVASYIGTSDYNNLLTTGTVFGNYGGTNRADFAAWKSASGKDGNSISINPVFLSNTDLHASAAGLDGKGAATTTLTTDIDGETRHSTTPDIGADEFTPQANDAALLAMTPSATYCRGVNDITVTLKNFGTATLTSAVINWNIGGTAQTAYNWTGSLASGATTTVTLGTYTFTGSAYNLDATVSSPNGATDPNVAYNTVSASPTAATTLSGTYTIGGTSPDYATFALAISALTTNGLCGPVTFNIRDGVYAERISLGVISGATVANTVTFQSESLDSTKVSLEISSTTTPNYVVYLNGTDYLTFKDLTFRRTGTGSNGRVIELTNGAYGNKFLNNRFYGIPTTSTNSTYNVVYVGATNFDSYNEFRNNRVKYGATSISLRGPSGSWASFNVISGNELDSFSVSGIYADYQANILIEDNVLTNCQSATGTGIYLAGSSSPYTIQRNKVDMPLGYRALELSVPTWNGSDNSLVANNFFTVGGTSASYGIYMSACFHVNLYHNSVRIYNTSTSSRGVYISNGTYQYLSNNVIANTGGGAAIEVLGNGVSTCNYNDLYTTGATLGVYSGNKANLAAWQAGTVWDDNSISVNPFFASSTDLTSGNCVLKNKGTNVSVTTDIDGTNRGTSYDLGARQLSLTLPGRWSGATSSAWGTASNWCDGTLPTSSTDVTIPTNNVTSPNHSMGTGAAKNLTVESGATLTVSGGTLSVHESLSNSGTLSQTGGAIDFAGTGSQQNVPAGTYYDLKVSGGGDKILLGDVSVTHNLDVSDGFLETGVHTVTLGSSATLTETGTDYVKGAVKATRTISATGTPETFGGLGLSITAGNASRLPGSTVVTRYTDRQLGTQYLQNGAPRIGMTRAFDIVPTTNGGLNATLVFNYTDGDLNAIDEPSLKLYRAPHSAGTTFYFQGITSLDQTNNRMTLTGIDSFSIWTGAGGNAGLPVALVSFEARWDGEAAALDWATASEEDNDFFAVERSLDGKAWQEIGRVQGSGTTNAFRSYSYGDAEAASLLSPALYYRLRQTDFNGEQNFSDIRILRRAGDLNDGRLRAAYDASSESLRATLTGREGQSLTLVLTDGLGRVVATQKAASGKGAQRVEISMQGLPAGFYTLQLVGGASPEAVKVIKN